MDKFKVLIPENCCEEDCDCGCWFDYESQDENYSPSEEDYDVADDIYEFTELTEEEKLELLEELSSLEERDVKIVLPDILEDEALFFSK